MINDVAAIDDLEKINNEAAEYCKKPFPAERQFCIDSLVDNVKKEIAAMRTPEGQESWDDEYVWAVIDRLTYYKHRSQNWTK